MNVNDNRTAIKDVQPGGPVSTVLRVIEKSTKKTRSDKPYLALTLADATGKIPGRVWNRAEHYAGLFADGDFVYVEAFAETFNNTLQLKIEHLERVAPEGVNLGAFEQASVYDPSQMAADLTNLVENEVGNVLIKRVLLAILEDEEVAAKLRRSPAAKLNHHAYVAGLLEHTLSMCRLALSLADHYADYYPGMVDRDLLIAGTVLHDIGKLWELGLDKGIDYTEVGRLVGHVVMGAELVTRTFQRLGIDNTMLEMRIKHLVLSHHGELEFGAPVRPLTAEAQLLNYIDQIDARMNMFAAAIGERTEGFTPFNRPLGRFVYAGSVGGESGSGDPSGGSRPHNGSATDRPEPVVEVVASSSTVILPVEPPEDDTPDAPKASLASDGAGETVDQTASSAGATDTSLDEPPFSVYESSADRATYDLVEEEDEDFDVPPWALAKAAEAPVAETEAATEVSTAEVVAEISVPEEGESHQDELASDSQPLHVETAASWRPEADEPETAVADGDGLVDTLTLDLFDDPRR